ncbi:MAG: bifunctional phosphoglucose/phosphomannose isomerase [Cytophagales bacterium]|nr:bifunctional phosphoglucose/phosphomannose isomerase [Bernardetiaceae bacterium]MDW8203887.1 bifunctional phosphoglucose/phosphomannose isomerase [Cytophagales bacterium]
MSGLIRKLIESYPTQVLQAIALGKQQQLATPSAEIRQVVIAGLGGSGIGGSLVKALTVQTLSVPVEVLKSYDVPAWIGKHTLVLASSHSGNTEETLTVVQQAATKGAQIVAITTGGQLANWAKANGWDWVQMPFEEPCPRQFLAYSLIAQLYVLINLGLAPAALAADIEEGAALVQASQDSIQQTARAIAARCANRLPFIYADERLGALALRFQQQINENAKQMAHVNVFPEMNHNELVGWRLPVQHLQQSVVILLRSTHNHPRVEVRMAVCEPIFRQLAADVVHLPLQGNSLAAQVLHFIHLTDWVSYFLAEINGVDAYEIDVINHLKNKLATVSA